MSVVNQESNSELKLSQPQVSRPIGVIILILLLILNLLLDFQVAEGEPNVILWSLIIFKVMVIIGLSTMARWGYGFVIVLLLLYVLFGALDLTLFLDDKIAQLAQAWGMNLASLNDRFVILSGLFMEYMAVLIAVGYIFWYLNKNKDKFTN
ncbi:MAG: hypothetical protein HeimC3_38070 [Candidatus Heimdallarchaeota archaeon LC_3]|nr:MAG: hypothetical protein HeimC3_38070 [Candidatus Heimdallarchaeota archaeon LC_3]